MGVLTTRDLPFRVYIRAPGFWKLPHVAMIVNLQPPEWASEAIRRRVEGRANCCIESVQGLRV